MVFKDILVQLSSYPEPTPVTAIDQAIAFAQAVGARISALTFEIVVHVPGTVLAPALLDVKGIIAAEHQRSIANAKALADAFNAAAARRGVAHEHFVEACENSQVPQIVTDYARLTDLTLIAVNEAASFQQFVAETVIFGSGRPTLVFPANPKRGSLGAIEQIAVAWDFSRPAARAVADAIPLMQSAKSVRVVTVTGERPIETRRSGAELARHLALHGIAVTADTEHAAGRSVGRTLADYVTAREIDLLVMGAYGHSRMREFILGGATESILNEPPAPVLLSH